VSFVLPGRVERRSRVWAWLSCTSSVYPTTAQAAHHEKAVSRASAARNGSPVIAALSLVEAPTLESLMSFARELLV
jgi:hypothetical protein